MIFTNEVEKTVYNFIKDSKEVVTFKLLKTRLGDNAVGTIGKLKQRDLVEIGRKRVVISAFPGFKYVKTLKIKEV